MDLALIPGMVEEKNLKYAMLRSSNNKSDTQLILEFARSNGGTLTLSDCIIATGKPTGDIKKLLNSLCLDGALEVENHPTSGAIIYRLS